MGISVVRRQHGARLLSLYFTEMHAFCGAECDELQYTLPECQFGTIAATGAAPGIAI
jgi:hypothetical protein